MKFAWKYSQSFRIEMEDGCVIDEDAEICDEEIVNGKTLVLRDYAPCLEPDSQDNDTEDFSDDDEEISKKKMKRDSSPECSQTKKKPNDTASQVGWRKPVCEDKTCDKLPIPVFTSAVHRGLRENRSEEVWDQVRKMLCGFIYMLLF